jgi:hypothetical protein
MANTNGAVLDPTQDIDSHTTVQRILDFESVHVPHIDANTLKAVMLEGGYDVMTWTRTQGGGMTIMFGWATE